MYLGAVPPLSRRPVPSTDRVGAGMSRMDWRTKSIEIEKCTLSASASEGFMHRLSEILVIDGDGGLQRVTYRRADHGPPSRGNKSWTATQGNQKQSRSGVDPPSIAKIAPTVELTLEDFPPRKSKTKAKKTHDKVVIRCCLFPSLTAAYKEISWQGSDCSLFVTCIGTPNGLTNCIFWAMNTFWDWIEALKVYANTPQSVMQLAINLYKSFGARSTSSHLGPSRALTRPSTAEYVISAISANKGVFRVQVVLDGFQQVFKRW
ncbi:hypothetical protein B0H19DRAFT_1081348 [Mycena capillaripes]|nr:hypothetical protein B0H19DRAFT_1081208 [Mycena capillaripes]KAJ6533183.1 hypothetical protein B0H19DRAFT_1081348 [Mycena capillaripes]